MKSITKYKKFVNNIFVAFITLSWSVNGFSSSSHKSVGEEKNSHISRQKLSDIALKSVIKMLEANEQLHRSFLNYNGKSVEMAAERLIVKIDQIKNKDILKLLNFSKVKLAEIKSSESRKENNQNYHLVSMALIHIIKTYDVGTKYNAYSCPMVKKKWIQNSQKQKGILNPYDPEMSGCGSKDSNF